ncbi:MAG: hypothetical protein FWG06_01410 [Clostridiales bacterium]|nr:hypothetical protein [Clostridiales bacterium]
MTAKIRAKMGMAVVQAKSSFGIFVKDERGDFGIGQIAAIVAAVVIIGLIVSIVTGNMESWIDTIWTDNIVPWFDKMTI